MKRNNRFFSVIVACGLASVFADALAQAYPTRAVRIVNPAAPGGNSDVFFRLLQPKMVEVLGQQLVIDYRVGAGGTIGGDVVAKSAPDGYTTGLMAASFVINPAMIKKMPFNTLKDFTPLGLIVDVPSGLVLHPSLPVRNLKELIALSKKRPGEIFYSTSGRGTVGHLSGELLNSMAGTKFVHVPYKGAGPAVIDLVAGQVQMQFASMPLLTGYIAAGRLRLIAQTGSVRSEYAPDIPTMEEAGLPGFVVRSGFSFVGPAGIAKPIADKLNLAMVTSIRHPENRKMLIQLGADPIGSSMEEHDAFIKSEIEKWGRLAKAAGIDPQ